MIEREFLSSPTNKPQFSGAPPELSGSGLNQLAAANFLAAQISAAECTEGNRSPKSPNTFDMDLQNDEKVAEVAVHSAITMSNRGTGRCKGNRTTGVLISFPRN